VAASSGPDMPKRKRPPLLFKQTDLLRVLRTYQAAGIPQPTVKITKEGDLIAIPGEPPKAGAAANPLDQWIESHADQTEGH
jgi:hypothetical protein